MSRITEGTTNQIIYFVGIEATDRVTRRLGLVSTNFTVAYANNSTSNTQMSSGNINVTELSTAVQPGVYALKPNEGTTLAAGNDAQEMVLTIAAGTTILPVTRTVEVYRPEVSEGNTLTVTSSGDIPWNAAWDAEVQSEVKDALESTVAEAYPATAGDLSVAQALYQIVQHMAESAISSTTWTIKKRDRSTTALTLGLDSTAPETITRTS